MALTTPFLTTKTAESHSWTQQAAQVLGASVLISLCAKLAIFLPFTPVPLGLQPLIVLLSAVMLGSKRGTLAVLAFIVQGACGMPVFAGGHAGLLWLAGPTGGYLLGYLPPSASKS